MASSPSYKAIIITTLAILFVFLRSSKADLSSDVRKVYPKCPQLFDIVGSVMEQEIQKDPRTGASLLRLHFHDCFVGGCDASVLLKDTSTFTGEQSATPNKNSIRKLEVIDQIKSVVENACPGLVSCADILAIAARDAIKILSYYQLRYDVEIGRLDSKTANRTAANNLIPPPTSNIDALINNFKNHGLNETDLVLLSGAHTIGQARCTSFKGRLYNETNSLDETFAKYLRKNCSPDDNKTGNNTANLDYQTPSTFDNRYYQNIIDKKDLLHSDHQLLNNSVTVNLVKKYSNDINEFYQAFGQAMIKMGRLNGTTGEKKKKEMEIRKVCSKRN
ncbi:Peroxidase 52 [Striga hermonthica]|uniref:Peroxidase n=1 Tax=Striga hermonthica TaxID=68872 RepID=A0A9N7RLI0_STRHE|nr:Peroxidase 52 [Striga hermonthica]